MASKLSSLISALVTKATPVDADKLPILNSADSDNFNWLSFSSLKTYLSGLYAAVSHNHSGVYIATGADAADLTSGTATDGHVLTADGSGGAAWEAVPGGDLVNDTSPQLGGDLDLNGSQITGSGGTVTTSQPILDVSQTWNNAAVTFAGIKANITDTASAAGSLLLDLQVGSASLFNVTKTGDLRKGTQTILSYGVIDAYTVEVPDAGFRAGTASGKIFVGNFGLVTNIFGMSANVPNRGTVPDVYLERDAANTFSQRNGTNAQTFRLYNTYTDASNYERLALTWDSNVAKIQPEAAGTGTLRNLQIGPSVNLVGGTVTTSKPVLDVSQTWNDAAVTFTGIKANITDTASAAASNLLDLQLNGASKFKVSKSGIITLSSNAVIAYQTFLGKLISFDPSGLSIVASISNNIGLLIDSRDGRGVGFIGGSASGGGNPDTVLTRDDADTLAQRRTTNAQTFRLYNTYTNSSNYERLALKWDSNVFKITTEALGTGTLRGLNIGEAVTSLVGFYGVTPVVQQASADQAVVTLGNADSEIGGLTFSSTPTQEECQALRDKCEELADDVRALSTLVHSLRTALLNVGLIKGAA
jgi:hypothetical protein